MVNFKRYIPGILSLFACGLHPGMAETLSKFSFGGPEVLKIDWTTRSMEAADINGDGLNDFALINNDRAKIEIFYQKGEGAGALPTKKKLNKNRWEPVLEDARFVGESITIGYPLFDLAVGDLNGDGRADLAYTTRDVPLTIRLQSETGTWINTQEFDSFDVLGWVQTVEISDLDQDGKNELVVVSSDAVRVFRQTKDGKISEPDTYYLTGDNPFNLMIADVTGDGLQDILYVTASGKQSLALREQSRNGAFGPEYRFIFERPVRSLRVFDHGDKKGPLFCSVDSRSGSLEFFHFEKSDSKKGSTDSKDSQLAIYPVLKDDKETPSYAIADLDGKGSYDMLVTNPAAAELIYFPSNDGEFLSSRVFPSFSGVTSIASGRFHKAKGDSVILVSEEERVIGLSRLNQSSRIGFPRQFSVGEGDPVVCNAYDFDKDGYAELVLLLEDDGDRNLVIAKPSSRKDLESEWEILASIELEDARRNPTAIIPTDIFGSERKGLAVIVPREAPIFITVDIEEDSFSLAEFAKESSVRDSLLKGIVAPQISVFDIDGDGQNELIAGRPGYARVLKAVGEKLEMVDQFNALRGDDEISAVIPVVNGRKKIEEIIFYIASTGEFQFLTRDADDVFRYERSRDIGALEIQDWFFFPTSSGEDKIVLTGMDSLWAIDPSRTTWRRTVLSSYETELENINFNYVNGGVFNTDEGLGLIAIDGNNHVVELLSMPEDTWESRVYWEIFEQNMHYQGRTGSNTEPREVVVSDFTGDGRLDFAFLIHDRILFYPQE